MAKLSIVEYANISTVGTGAQGINKVQVGNLCNVVAFNGIALTSTSQPSSQLNAKTNYVRLCTDTNCYVIFSPTTSTGTTASTSSMYLPADTPEYIAVNGSGWLAAIL